MNTGPVYLPRIRVERDNEGQSTWSFTSRTMGLSVLLLLLASLVGSFYLSQASHTATAGLEVVRLAERREHLRQDNAELRTLIAEMQAASNVRRRALELGFVDAEGTEYLAIDELRIEPTDQVTLDRGSGEEETPGTADSVSSELAYWWGELMAEIDSWTNARP